MLAFRIIAAIFLLFLLGVLLIVFFLGVGHKSKNEKSSTQFLSFFSAFFQSKLPKSESLFDAFKTFKTEF